MKLRPYQQECVDSVIAGFHRADSLLVVMATGLGKTVTLSHIASIAGKGRVLVVAHREELIHQLSETIKLVTNEEVGIEMADRRASDQWWGAEKIVVATVQTLTASGGRRLSALIDKPDDWSLLVIDEAHHAAADTYRAVVDRIRQNKKAKVLGVTATPDRKDKVAMGSIFEDVAYRYDIREAIEDGWLVPIRMQSIYIEGLDYSQIRTTAGDLNGADLAKVIEDEEHLHAMAHPTLEISGTRPVLAFLPTVESARMFCNILNRWEPDVARWVCGKTPKIDRHHAVADYKEGRCRILCNVGVFTEGFDAPHTACVMIGTATKSRAKYVQMIGRGTRPLPGIVDASDDRDAEIEASGKPDLLVLDFYGNPGNHSLCSPVSMLGGKYPDDVVQLAHRKAAESDGDVDPDDVLEAAAEEIERKREEALQREEEERRQRQKIRIPAKYTAKAVSAFDSVGRHMPKFNIDNGMPTQKTTDFLAKHGVEARGMDRKQADVIRREIFRRFKAGLCSLKQAKILSKRGLSTEVSRKEASRMIDEISEREGWGART